MYTVARAEEVSVSGIVRKEFELTTEQLALLQRRSREIGVTEDELVRRAIDALCEETKQQQTRQDAWKRLMDAMEQRALMDVPQTGRKWTREELHDARGHF